MANVYVLGANSPLYLLVKCGKSISGQTSLGKCRAVLDGCSELVFNKSTKVILAK